MALSQSSIVGKPDFHAAEPARQLFLDVRVFARLEGMSFVVRQGQYDFNTRFISRSIVRNVTE
jgi:hypothetical protein